MAVSSKPKTGWQLTNMTVVIWIPHLQEMNQPILDINEITQVRIQDLVKEGVPASKAESCQCSKAESYKWRKQSVAAAFGF